MTLVIEPIYFNSWLLSLNGRKAPIRFTTFRRGVKLEKNKK